MASSTPHPGEHDPLLQRRVTWVLRAVTALLAVFLVYVAAEGGVEGEADRALRPAGLIHAGAVALNAGTAWFMGRGERTVRQAYLAEAFAVVTTGWLLALMLSYSHVGYRPEFTIVTGMTVVVVGRSAIVPSSWWRTAVLCALTAVPVAWVTWNAYVGYVPPAPPPGVASYPSMSPAGVTLFMMLWWLASSALATAVSHVIYGLRRAIDQARRLGQYALVEPIGEGGMGQVYRARHAFLRRPTAIKLLAGATEAQVKRFEREVQLTASLTHPNTIAVFDYGRTPDGIFYYAMEYLDGLDIERLVGAHGPQPAARVIHILMQVCDALAEAHEAGLIHRDIKPANVVLCERGGVPDVAKVLDFGLVKSLEADDADPRVTTTDAVMGTPLYMSPEGIKTPDEVDARSDLYSLGAVGYVLASGRPPFEGATVVEVCAHHLHTAAEPPSAHGVDVPADLERVLLDCLAKDPAARPASASALREALERCDAAGAWSREDATAWWREHGAAAPAADRAAITGQTIEVALSGR